MKLILCLLINVEGFFQTNTIILGVCGQACPNYLKKQAGYFSTLS